MKLTGKAVLIKTHEVEKESREKVNTFFKTIGYVMTSPITFLFHFENLDKEENRIKQFDQFKGNVYAHFTSHPTKTIHTLKIQGAL